MSAVFPETPKTPVAGRFDPAPSLVQPLVDPTERETDMMSPNDHHRAATDLLAVVDRARAVMDGQMVEPEMAMQIQAALALDVAIAQVHATLATRKESDMR